MRMRFRRLKILLWMCIDSIAIWNSRSAFLKARSRIYCLSQMCIRDRIIAVVIAAAYANGIFLENTVVRGGFSGVQKLDPGSLKKSCNLAGVGGDSAHSLEIVEGGSFSAKEHTDISCLLYTSRCV